MDTESDWWQYERGIEMSRPTVPGNVLRITVQPLVADKLRDLAKKEKRSVALQAELILEKYFDQLEKKTQTE